jgi:sarcosine oxidase subunit alpha
VIQEVDFLIIGGGPAGLTASLSATDFGIETYLLDDGLTLGGQLTKQTHKFFGSKMERAGIRGFVIGKQMVDELAKRKNFKSFLRTTAAGLYEDRILTAVRNENEWLKFLPKRILISTGASERMIAFPGNDLPGVYGAGAVQTLMNVYGVKPGERVLMIGAGNIGLIVSYQLMQAGVNVAGIVEITNKIGGYWVHASKIRRLGVPILTNYTIVEARGDEVVNSAVIAKVDENFQVILGSEIEVPVDTICLAVGLNPTLELLIQAGIEMKYIPMLGGDVPLRDHTMRTNIPNIYVAGDAAGIEEASSAMIEGNIVGLAVTKSLGVSIPDFNEKIALLHNELKSLRAGPLSEKIKIGLSKVTVNW